MSMSGNKDVLLPENINFGFSGVMGGGSQQYGNKPGFSDGKIY